MSEIRLVENVKENVAKVIVGKEEQTEALLLALKYGVVTLEELLEDEDEDEDEVEG